MKPGIFTENTLKCLWFSCVESMKFWPNSPSKCEKMVHYEPMNKLDIKRRHFVLGIAMSGCLSAPGWPALGAVSKATLGVSPVTDRITLIQGAGGNVVLFKGDRGMTVIDSGSRDMTSELVANIEKQAPSMPMGVEQVSDWH